MITNNYEAKVMAEHISCDCKCKFSSIACLNSNLNQIKYGILKHVNMNVKIISMKETIAEILAHAFWGY